MISAWLHYYLFSFPLSGGRLQPAGVFNVDFGQIN